MEGYSFQWRPGLLCELAFFYYTSEVLQFIVSRFRTLRSRNFKCMSRYSDSSVSHFKTLDTADTFEAFAWRIYVSRHFKRKRVNFTCLYIKVIGYVKKTGISFTSYAMPCNQCRWNSFVYISCKSINQYVVRYSSVHVITRLKLESVCTWIMLDTWANLMASLFLICYLMLRWQRNTKI